MENFLRGVIAMGLAVAGLFFLRFWRETHDRLFAAFALAFFILAVNRATLAFMVQSQDEPTFLYLVRLLAFVIILIAIVDKNLSRK